MHPALLAQMARQLHDERRAELQRRGEHRPEPGLRRTRHPLRGLRRGTGWTLIELGLRLALRQEGLAR